VIGAKNSLRFQCRLLARPMLLSAGWKPPQQVFLAMALTREGQKMGKSLGNVLDPAEPLLEHYGADAVRWNLLKRHHLW